MKRIIVFYFLIVLLLTACQATPEEAVVVQKDTEEMLAMASGEEAESNAQDDAGLVIRDTIGVPESWEMSIMVTSENLSIDIDADILVPEVEEIPIVWASAADFSQGTIDGLIDVLYADETPYEIQYGASTKSQIEARIVELEWLKKTAENRDEDIEALDEKIASLTAAYADAPEESGSEYTVTDGKLKYAEYESNSTGKTLMRTELNLNTDEERKKTKRLSVTNQSVWVEDFATIEKLDANIRYVDYTQPSFNRNSQKPIIFAGEAESEAAVEEKLKISAEEAVEYADDLLARAGITDMQIHHAFLVDDEELGTTDGIYSDAENYAYEILYTRAVNDVPCGFREDFVAADETYIQQWQYERLIIVVNDDGVVTFKWWSPLEIGETEVESAQLLGFDEIFKKIASQLKTQYDYMADDIIEKAINIDRIALEYQRMNVKDGTFGEALLVPVWNVCGIVTYDTRDGYHANEYNLLFSINAVDGSAFNSSEGY